MTESPSEHEGMPDERTDDEATSPSQGEAPVADEGPTLEEQLAERTADLQRVQAEFINYKRRVEDDRLRATKNGQNNVMNSLLTVLDDIDRADEHGELVGGFKAVADAVKSELGKFGLRAFGAEGEEFDPNLHEAVVHVGHSTDAKVTSIAQVMRVGYAVDDRVLRAAVVGVVDPAPEAGVDDAVETGSETE